MKKAYSILAASLALFVLGSCTSYKKIPYLQSAFGLNLEMSNQETQIKVQKIMPSDQLYITVNSSTPESAIPFNLPLVPVSNMDNSRLGINNTLGMQTYLVNEQGEIEFPILGKLRISGMSKSQVQDMIKRKIYPTYLKEPPIVTVRFVNYQVSLLGEVNRPGAYTITNDKINIMEALALAGDLTIYGRRDNVLLLRENGYGKKEAVKIDLTDKSLLLSPYYYLQQNDIIYVQPNKSRARGSNIGTAETLTISVIGTLISLTGLIITVLK